MFRAHTAKEKNVKWRRAVCTGARTRRERVQQHPALDASPDIVPLYPTHSPSRKFCFCGQSPFAFPPSPSPNKPSNTHAPTTLRDQTKMMIMMMVVAGGDDDDVLAQRGGSTNARARAHNNNHLHTQ